MKKHTKFFISLGALLLTVSAAGCGGSDTLYSADAPITISVWTYYNGNQLTAFQDLVSEFNETEGKKTGIYVESTSMGSVDDLITNVTAAARKEVGADKLPNLFAAYTDTAYQLDKEGILVDLNDYLTDKEKEAYVADFLKEGDWNNDGSLKIFPTAKSVELLTVNATDWEPFAAACGYTYDDLASVESLVSVAQAYYEWTDAQTPEPNDGKAFFGRDSMANYMLVGSMQLGLDLFPVEDGSASLNLDQAVIRKLWDNYYLPYIKGYFAASGRFRSDDVKTGEILSYVGSSSSVSFFPDQVIISDNESYPIQMKTLPAPQFEGGDAVSVQQGAGMAVTNGSEAEVQASVAFLKWFTSEEPNLKFSIGSGYLPVTTKALDMNEIKNSGIPMDETTEEVLSIAADTVMENTMFTLKAFDGSADAREILNTCLSDTAAADREKVEALLAEGKTLEEATAAFTTDEYFNQWYSSLQKKLENVLR